jgi:hypothetical protein
MGKHALACIGIMLLLLIIAAVQNVLLTLLLSQVDVDSSAASMYVTGTPVVAIIVSGITFDRYFKRCSVYSLTHGCTVHYKQTSHVVAALAFVSSSCACILLLMLHPLSSIRTSPHPALVHSLLVTRTLAASCLIAPSIASAARLTAPHALPFSFSLMLLGVIIAHVLQLDGMPSPAFSQPFESSVWVATGCAVAELLICCVMMLIERQMAVTAHVRVLSYEFQQRGQQVHARISSHASPA